MIIFTQYNISILHILSDGCVIIAHISHNTDNTTISSYHIVTSLKLPASLHE